MFVYRFIKFQFNFDTNRFEPIVLDTYLPYEELRSRYTKLKSEKERLFQRIKFGKCIVDVPKQTIIQLLIHEVLNPFYIF